MSDVQVAEESNVSFTHEGEEYSVHKDALGNLDVVEPWEEGKYVLAVRELLGPDQWRRFKVKGKTYGDCLALFGDVIEAVNKANKDD